MSAERSIPRQPAREPGQEAPAEGSLRVDGLERVRTLVFRSSAADRVVYGLVASTLLAAVAFRPVIRAIEPRVPLTEQFATASQPIDPWGRPFMMLYGGGDEPIPPEILARGGVYFWYSIGPDGVDQRGQGGDDTFVLAHDDWRLRLASAEASLVMLGMAVALGACWELARLLRRQLGARAWAGPGWEAARAGAVALPAAVVGGGLALLLPLRALLSTPQALLVPFPLAVGGAAWLVVTLVVLWHRSRTVGRDAGESRPLEEEGPKPI